MPKLRSRGTEVFPNIPYDNKFQNLYLSYIAAICALGLAPRATLEIPGGTRRLERIFRLIRDCQYSVHDLSRIQLDARRPRTPRFNMPFELGLAVAWAGIGEQHHKWFVFEAMNYRLAKSLSDLNGTDPYIHDGRIDGVFRELCNAFVRPGRQPNVPQMRRVYREVKKALPRILRAAGTRSLFQARAFKEVSVVANAAAGRIVR